MWTMTKYGFFSIVMNRFDDSGQTWFVRSRVSRDLNNLMNAAGIDHEIHESTGSDYRFRIVITADDLERIGQCLFSNVDYTNFKSTIENTDDQSGRAHLYHIVWQELYTLQSGSEPPRFHPPPAYL